MADGKPQEIEMVFGADGESVSVTSRGFAGPSCKEATADYEKVLGTVTADVPTAEMKQAETTVQNHIKRGT